MLEVWPQGRDEEARPGAPRARGSGGPFRGPALTRPVRSPQKWTSRAWSLAPASWTVWAAAVTWTTTTACGAAAAATAASGPRAGGLAAPASRRRCPLRSSARPPACPAERVDPPVLEASPRAHCCAILEAPPPPGLPACRSGPTAPPAPPTRAGTPSGGGAQLPHTGAQHSRAPRVLRYPIIPEVLNVIAANLGGRRVRGLMTTTGSSDPNPGSQEKGVDRGRKAWLSVHPSICWST